MKRYAILLLVGLMAIPCLGQTLEITGPTEAVQPSESVWLQAENITLDEIKSAREVGLFDVTVHPSLDVVFVAGYDLLHEQPTDNLGVLFTAKYPGDYLLKFNIVRTGKMETASVVVIVDGEKPDPGPGPGPGPLPPPTKATWAVIVEERSDRTQLPANQRLVFESAKVRELMPAGQFLLLDRNSTDPDVKPYIDQAATMTLPILFLVDDSGEVVFSGQLPATVDATVELIGEHAGGAK